MKMLFITLLILHFSCSEKRQEINTIPYQTQIEKTPEKETLPTIKSISEDSIVSEQAFDAVFIRLESGDYYHVVVLDSLGQSYSLWMSNYIADSTFAKLLKQDSLSGKRVSVIVRNIESYIPEAETTLTIPELIDLQFK